MGHGVRREDYLTTTAGRKGLKRMLRDTLTPHAWDRLGRRRSAHADPISVGGAQFEC